MTIKISRNDHKNDLFVIITERDSREIFKSDGAIVGEQYTKNADIDQILDRSKSLSRYGKRFIARLEIIGEADEIEIID